MAKNGGRWSYSAGHPPYTVRVYERKGRPNLYVATWEDGREVKRSLGHSDREKAKALADRLAPEIREGADRPPPEAPTVAYVFRLYENHRTPDKSERVQAEDERQLQMWTAVLGPSFDLRDLSRREWDRFVRERRSGAIGPRGERVRNEKERTPVSDRTVERDLRFLRAVCNWAREFRGEDGEWLLEADPTRGLPIPQETNPKRPVATHDRVEAIRRVYRNVTMRVERGGARKLVESYLPEIFEIVVGTGRRISAVCSLRLEDLDLESTPSAPDGAIVWPEDTDKMDRRWRCPISGPVREALEAAKEKRARVLSRVGPGPLFPSPGTPDRALRYEEASAWLREAERLAKLEPQEGTLWHAYRRLWATARKNLPDVDVAQAGGWSSLEALKLAYQRPDDTTMLRVVQHATELRETK